MSYRKRPPGSPPSRTSKYYKPKGGLRGRPQHAEKRTDWHLKISDDLRLGMGRLAMYLSGGGERYTSELVELALEYFLRHMGYDEYLPPEDAAEVRRSAKTRALKRILDSRADALRIIASRRRAQSRTPPK